VKSVMMEIQTTVTVATQIVRSNLVLYALAVLVLVFIALIVRMANVQARMCVRVMMDGLALTVLPLFAVHVCMELARLQTHARVKLDTLVMIAALKLMRAHLALNAPSAHVMENLEVHIAVELCLIIVAVGGGINTLP